MSSLESGGVDKIYKVVLMEKSTAALQKLFTERLRR